MTALLPTVTGIESHPLPVIDALIVASTVSTAGESVAREIVNGVEEGGGDSVVASYTQVCTSTHTAPAAQRAGPKREVVQSGRKLLGTLPVEFASTSMEYIA